MVLALRVRSVHTGLAGGPYLTTMIFDAGVDPNINELRDNVEGFWNSMRLVMVGAGTVQMDSEIQVFDPDDGAITTTYNISTTAINYTSGTPEWTAKQGNLKLRSGAFKRGRRVQGRLYCPGVASNAGEQVPLTAYKNQIVGAAEELQGLQQDAATPWCVWSRPSAPGVTDGSIHPIVNISAANQWAVLRSRRT